MREIDLDRRSSDGQGPLIRHPRRWVAATAVLSVVALTAAAYLSGVRANDLTATVKKWWAAATEKIQDLRDGPPERQVQVSLGVSQGAKTVEGAYSTIRIAGGDLMREQFPRDAERLLPPNPKNNCAVDAQLFVAEGRSGKAITATYLVGLPAEPALAGAPEVRENTAERGAAQIVDLTGISVGVHELHVEATFDGAPTLKSESVELKITDDKVLLDGRELACRVERRTPRATTPEPSLS